MLKEHLINLLKVNRIQDALEQLMSITDGYDDQTSNDLMLLSARFNANNGMYNKGLLTYDQLKLENNKIYHAALNYLNQIASQDYFHELTQEEIDSRSFIEDQKKTKILFIASNPVNTPKFELEKEYLEIRRIFTRQRDQFEVIESFHTTLDQFFNMVRIEQPDILHIAAPSNNKYLVFHRPDDTIRSVPYHFLTSAFSLFQPYVKCVFLNTWCPPVFLKKVSQSLQNAIGSNTLVDDNMSVLFSSGFYTALAQHSTYREAFEIGKEVLGKRDKYLGKEIPFVMFQNGISTEPDDDTPEEFEIEEPEDLRGK